MPNPETLPGTLAETLHGQLASSVLAGLQGGERARGEALLGTLVRDWVAEAGSSGMADSVLSILRNDLATAMSGLGPAERLAVLEAEVLDREIQVVSRQSLALGKAIIDRAVSDEEARQRGQDLLARVKELAPRIDAVTDEARRLPLRRQLEEAMLEALYAVERKAMSSRLNLYLRDRQGGGSLPPPKVSP